MQTLIQMIVGLVALIAATALAQFGVDVSTSHQAEREVRRLADCTETTGRIASSPPTQNC